MLKLKNVSKFYYNKGIIASGITKINLELKMGEFIAITGESGSGKSTLLNVISGLDSYEEGEMYINGKETSHYTEKDFEDYRRKYIANIFQNFNLVNSYTVYQNVELALLLNGYKKRQIKKKVLDIIKQVGLSKFKNTKVSKLSGGQKQRVAIARAMVKETPIIVADEPTGNLDTESAKDIIKILKEVAKNKLVIIVTHNIEQVEEYATRIITMNDGRIIEDRKLKEVNNDIAIKVNKYNKMTLFNKFRLGLRNTFNIKSKFFLLFSVFLFITLALSLEYASFKMTEEESVVIPTNRFFNDLSENRIIIKKADKTAFGAKDYNNIKKIENVDYIVENDIFLDTKINLNRNSISEYVTFSVGMNDISNFKEKVDVGRIPESDNEIVLQTSRKNYYIEENLDEVLNKTFLIEGISDDNIIEQLKIVGIKYNDNDKDYTGKIYMSSEQLEKLRVYVNKMNSKLRTFFNNQYDSYRTIVPSDKVEKGQAVVSDDWNYQVEERSVSGMNIIIEVQNIYYTDELDLEIEDTFSKNSFNRLTGYESFDKYRQAIFVNKEEYESLFNKPSYQSSVYVKNTENIDETVQELENLGMDAKKITDYKKDDISSNQQIVKLIKTIVTVILVIVLFFVSYFIIRIILKSRNIYYTTLRMLGSTYRDVKQILTIELFVNSSIAYIVSLILFSIIKNNIIKFTYLPMLIKYLGIKEYVLIYIILLLISILISRKVSKNLFKDTAINTYNEEV